MRLAQLNMMACVFLLTQACSNTPTNSNLAASQACQNAVQSACTSQCDINSCTSLIQSCANAQSLWQSANASYASCFLDGLDYSCSPDFSSITACS